MRRVVAYENALDNDWFIHAGGLVVEDKMIPVVWNFNYDVIIGWAYDLQRDEEWCEVSFDLKIHDARIADDMDFLACSIYANNIESDRNDAAGIIEIERGVIRSIAITPGFPRVRA